VKGMVFRISVTGYEKQGQLTKGIYSLILCSVQTIREEITISNVMYCTEIK
jgi:hypothetical protein